MYFDYVYSSPPVLSRSTPTLPSQFGSLFLSLISIEFSLCWPSTLGWGARPGIWQYKRVHTFKENWLSLSNSYQMTIAPQPRVELCSHILRFYLAWACAYLVYAVTISMNSYVQLPCCVFGKHWVGCFFWSYPPCLALTYWPVVGLYINCHLLLEASLMHCFMGITISHQELS